MNRLDKFVIQRILGFLPGREGLGVSQKFTSAQLSKEEELLKDIFRQKLALLRTLDPNNTNKGHEGTNQAALFTRIYLQAKASLTKEQYNKVIELHGPCDIQRYINFNEKIIENIENFAICQLANYLYENDIDIPINNPLEIRLWLNNKENKEFIESIYSLDLSGLKFRRLPREIGLFRGLRELELDGCELKSLPDEFFNLVNLQSLDLTSNEFRTIDPRIFSLPNLQCLNVVDNKIEKLPDEPPSLSTSLIDFALENNNLTSIPLWIGRLKNLKELTFAKNKLTKMPEGIKELKNLEQLYLDNNKIEVLPEWLGSLKSLWILALSNNLISAWPNFSRLVEISELYLEGNKITSILKEYLPRSEYLELEDIRKQVRILEEGGAKKRVKVEPEDAKGGGGSK